MAKSNSVDADRQARWEAFLEKAREQRVKDGTAHIFDAQKAAGEFDKIPDNFA